MFHVASGNNVIRGLSIYNAFFSAIHIESGDGNRIEANHLGVRADGTTPGRTCCGVFTRTASNVIGGTTPGAGNVISGNDNGIVLFGAGAHDNRIEGNVIGANRAGTQVVAGNIFSGVSIQGGRNNVVGGTNPAAANVIVGATFAGVDINDQQSTGNTVLGNYIGTNKQSATGLGNQGPGVFVKSSDTVIGGTVAGSRNIISGNGQEAIALYDSANHRVEGNYMGTDASGQNALPNGTRFGHATINLIRASGSTIGGTAVGAGNAISGNNGGGVSIDGPGANSNIIQGNIIGPALSLTVSLGNNGPGVRVGEGVAGTTIGGAAAASGNVIAGSKWADVELRGTQAVVQGNIIGTNPAGTLSLRKTYPDNSNTGGLYVGSTAADNLVGGSVAAARNLIAAAQGLWIEGQRTRFEGNYLGVTAAGGAGLGMFATAIGTSPASADTLILRNVIAGAQFDGIYVDGAGDVVEGNFVGVNAAGTAMIGNGANAVRVGPAARNSRVGGFTPSARNLLAGSVFSGVLVDGVDALVVGNYMGTNAAGTVAFPNGDGVTIRGPAQRARIGGTQGGAGNVISGNTNTGISVAAGATATVLQGNRIGTNAAGTAALANGGVGVFLDGTGTAVGGTAAGASNLIANNGQAGVRVNTGTGHAVLGNSIFSNGGLGIDIGLGGVTGNDAGDGDTGANNLQNYPVLAAAAGGVQGTFNSSPNGTFTIQYTATPPAIPRGMARDRPSWARLQW